MPMPKATYKAYVPFLLLSPQQPCEVGDAESEGLAQDHAENLTADGGVDSRSSTPQSNSLTTTPSSL